MRSGNAARGHAYTPWSWARMRQPAQERRRGRWCWATRLLKGNGLLAGTRPALPVYWTTCLLQDGDDCSKIAAVDEEDSEGKLAEQRSPDWVGFDWKLPRILRDALKDGVQLGEEARNQGWVSRVIPRQCFVNVELRAIE
jgi:hypothetical protein